MSNQKDSDLTPSKTPEKSEKEKKKKKPKKQGPLRLEAIIPITIICVGVWAYVFFLLDSHLRMGTEFAASKIYGAEVNVARITIKFGDPSLTVEGIQVTDKAKPELNAIAIEKIRFALLWDALLRAKFVVDESSINGIALSSPRKKPGFVYPPEPPAPSTGPSLTDQIAGQVASEAEAQLSQNIFGDIVKVMQGSDAKEQLKSLQAQLQSEQKIKEVEAALNAKKEEWKKRIDSLPKSDELKAIADKIKNTKINTSNPAEAKSQLEGLRAELKKADAIVDTYSKGQKDLQGDVGGFDQSLKDIEAFIQKDINDLQNRFQVPTIDTDNMTKALFSKLLGDKLTMVTGYMDMAKKYMPDKPKGEAAAPKQEYVPHPRSKGRTYKFPITVGYPLFWLRKAEISSSATDGGFSGDFTGRLLDLTSDPAFINKPTLLTFAGSAEPQKLRDIKFNLVMDYRGEQGFSKLDFSIGSHPFPAQSFAKSSDITFELAEAEAKAIVAAEFTGDTISASIEEVITPPKFITDAKAPLLKEALTKITERIKVLTMEVSLSGKYSSPRFGLNSNLGTELGKGLRDHLQGKIDEAKAEFKKYVDERVGKEKARITDEYNKLRSTYTEVLDSKKKEFETQKNDLEKLYKDKGKADTAKAKEEIKDKAKDALKKLKF